MTAAEICAELLELIDNRRAIDIIAERHECTYTDICLLIGRTGAFKDFCDYHGRQKKAEKKPPTLLDHRLSQMYMGGITVKEISKSEGMSEAEIYKRLRKCDTIAHNTKG